MAIDVEGTKGHNQNTAMMDRIQLRTKKFAENNGTEEIYKSSARQG